MRLLELRRLSLAGLMLMLWPAGAAVAAAVSWVPNADGLWQTASNWTSSPSLPGAADDVTIDRPAAITVTLSSGNQSIRSLLSQEGLVIGNGTALTLTVGAGGGQINGPLTVSPGAQLESNFGGTLHASGSVTANSANLLAQSNSRLELPTLTSYSSGASLSQIRAFTGADIDLSLLTSYTVGSGGSIIEAEGTGGTVNLAGLTSFVAGANGNTRVYAETGGSINLSNLTSITVGNTDAIAVGVDSTIDFTSLTTFSGSTFNDTRRFRAAGGGKIISPNLTVIGPRTHVELSGATSALDLADVVNFDEINFLAQDNAVLTLPAGITSYTSGAGHSLIRAFEGGDVNFPQITSYTVGSGGSTIQANGAGSTVNLSGLTSFSAGANGNTRVYAENSGTVNLSAVTALTIGNVDAIANGGIIDFTNLTTFSGNNFNDLRRFRAAGGGQIISPNLTIIGPRTHVELSGATSVLDLADVTNFDELNFLAQDNAVFSLPAGITSYTSGAGHSLIRAFEGGDISFAQITTYTVGTGGSTIQANGAGSTVDLSGVTFFSPGPNGNTRIYAETSGTINLSALTALTIGNVDAIANGGVIDFTNLTTFSGSNFNDLRRFRAAGGGRIISPNLTIIGPRTHVELSGATSVLDLADVTNFDEVNFLAQENALFTLPAGITSYTSGAGHSFIRAFESGDISFPQITSYTVGTGGSTIQANGSGSTVNLSGLTSFSAGANGNTRVYAETGGTINLSAVTAITVGNVDAIANGVGSVINFTNLTTFSGSTFNDLRRFRAAGGGQIISPNLTTIGPRTHVELSGATSVLDLADVTNVSEVNFLAEENAVLTLPAGVTSYASPAANSLIRAFSGGDINFPLITSYAVGTAGSTIQASGTGSTVNLSGLTSISAGTVNNTKIYAQSGGTIDLSHLATITAGAVDALAQGSGSIIDFSGLSAFSLNNFFDTRRIRAETGGTIRIKATGTTTVSNATVELVATGTITGDTLGLGAGGVLNGNGDLDANLTNSAGTIRPGTSPGSIGITGNFTQTDTGALAIEIGGLTPVTQSDHLQIDGTATLGGVLQVTMINNFAPVFGQSVEILFADGGVDEAFDVEQLAPLTGGLKWDVIYNAKSVTIQVVNFYGDYNGNGTVDAADYTVWRNSLGATGVNLPADGDRNLVVNRLDYDFWKSRFGNTSGSGTGSALVLPAVPEPASMMLVVVACLLGLPMRPRFAFRLI